MPSSGFYSSPAQCPKNGLPRCTSNSEYMVASKDPFPATIRNIFQTILLYLVHVKSPGTDMKYRTNSSFGQHNSSGLGVGVMVRPRYEQAKQDNPHNNSTSFAQPFRIGSWRCGSSKIRASQTGQSSRFDLRISAFRRVRVGRGFK